MDLQKLLRLGDRIDLRIGGQHYRSVVQDIPSEHELLALHPLDKRNLPVRLENDTDVEVIIFRADGQRLIHTRLESRSRVGNVSVVLLIADGREPVRIQRRNAYRLPYRTRVVLTPVQPAPSLEPEYITHTVDLSEGGMRVEFPAMIGIGTQFDASMSIFFEGDNHKLTFRVGVSRMLPPDRDGAPWNLGLRFVGFPEEKRRMLVRFILLEQVNRRMD